MTWWFGGILGFGAAGFAIIGLSVGNAWTAGRHHLSSGWGFPGALAFALTGPLVYVGGQLVSAGI